MNPNTPSESKGSPTYFAPVFVSATMGPAPQLGEGSPFCFSQGSMIHVSPVGGPGDQPT